jgi:hypothetical protein
MLSCSIAERMRVERKRVALRRGNIARRIAQNNIQDRKIEEIKQQTAEMSVMNEELMNDFTRMKNEFENIFSKDRIRAPKKPMKSQSYLLEFAFLIILSIIVLLVISSFCN